MADINILIVGGGGGRSGKSSGYHHYNPGGGGEVKEFTITAKIGETSVTVGAAGATGSDDSDNSTDGGDSYFGELKANGGKRGRLYTAHNVVAGASGSGKTGGTGLTAATGGGGGDSAAGGNAPSSSVGGNGGAGTLKWGSYYGAGGGGKEANYGAAGTGWQNAGRGGGCHNSPTQYFNALKGLVKVKYLTAELECSGGDKTTDGDYTIHTFTENGTFEVLRIISSTGILLWWF